MGAKQQTKKQGWRLPSAFTILFALILFVAVLTWLIPAGEYQVNEAGEVLSGTYRELPKSPQGLWDVIRSPFIGMLGAGPAQGTMDIALFILTMGGFLAIVEKTGALASGLSAFIRRFKGKETLLIWALMFVFALGGTTFGMAEETLPFFPLLLPMMVSVGMDSLVAVSIALLGSGVGVVSATVNPFSTGVASSMAGIPISAGLGYRIIFFIVTYVIAAGLTTRYAKRVQADPNNSLVPGQRAAILEKYQWSAATPQVTKKQKGVLALFIFSFLVMILGLVPWSDLSAHLTIFEDLYAWLGHIPWVQTLLGQSFVPLGHWSLLDMMAFFLLMSVLISWYWGFSEGEMLEIFIAGAKELLAVAFICAVARGIQIVMNDGHITATLLHWGEGFLRGLPQSLFLVLTYLFYLPLSFLIPSSSGLAAATIGIVAPLAKFASVPAHLVVTAFQSANGLINLLTPTSGVVMGALAIAEIPLTTWWRYLGKIVLALLGASILMLVLFAWL